MTSDAADRLTVRLTEWTTERPTVDRLLDWLTPVRPVFYEKYRTYVHTFMCMCMRTYVHVYVHTYVHVYVHTYVHSCMYCKPHQLRTYTYAYSHLLNCSSKRWLEYCINSQAAEIKCCQSKRVSFDWDDCEYVALEWMSEWRTHAWFKVWMSERRTHVWFKVWMSEWRTHAWFKVWMSEWRTHVWFKVCMSIQHVVKIYITFHRKPAGRQSVSQAVGQRSVVQLFIRSVVQSVGQRRHSS